VSELSVAVLCMAACVFAASASAKLRSRHAYQSFRAGLRDTRLISERWTTGVASLLCAAETVTAAGLLAAAIMALDAVPGARSVTEASLTAACLLTIVLAAGVGAVMRRGTQARCACFGAGAGRQLGGVHMLRNLILLVLLAAGLAGSVLGDGHPTPAAAIVGVAAGALAALLIIRWEDLADLLAPLRGST
jgi:energy-converting hydrogenase Eha subunit A